MSSIISRVTMSMSDTIIIIPSRIGSTRLNKKALQLIGNMTMVEHVYKKASSTGIMTYVATDSEDIADVVIKTGGNCIMTSSNCQSGTDRVHEAWSAIKDRGDIRYIINLQGDMPLVNPEIILQVVETLRKTNADIVTPVTKVDMTVAESKSNVKVVVDNHGRALYFSRSVIPNGAQEFWYHIGIYGFKVEALQKFIQLPQSYLEKSENLEQLRAVENGMTISVCYASSAPISVDIADELEKVREEYYKL
jgi:3-deoxy-manno-octulosonate cytidylyltransferase (CMP-KDO synthetase)